MSDTYKGNNLEIINKALYCNQHSDTESCENWLNLLRDRLASAAPAALTDAALDELFDLALRSTCSRDRFKSRAKELMDSAAKGDGHAD